MGRYGSLNEILFLTSKKSYKKKIGINDPRGESLFMTEAIMNPVSNKAGMAEIMF